MEQIELPVLTDPRTKYATPKFPRQKQDLPGSETEMEPKPDHGEETYRGSGKLKGLVALVTGGDSGIGRAVALAFAREGAHIAFTYLEEEADAAGTEELITEAGQRAESFRIDQSSREDCDKTIEAVLKKFGRLDILVNNAAKQMTFGSIEDMSDEAIQSIFSTNIEPFFYFARAALKHLPPGGSIINTTSIQAFSPSPHLGPYSATKAAIANFTISLAREAIHKGVRVNAVAPGPVWTPLIPASMPQDDIENFGQSSIIKRPAQPAELAPVYVFLASDEASYVTGEIYGVTGGMKQL